MSRASLFTMILWALSLIFTLPDGAKYSYQLVGIFLTQRKTTSGNDEPHPAKDLQRMKS